MGRGVEVIDFNRKIFVDSYGGLGQYNRVRRAELTNA